MMARASLLSALAVVLLAPATATAQQISGSPGSPEATTTIEGKQLPPPPQKFDGKIERNAAQSKALLADARGTPKGSAEHPADHD
jgi:hypothetical protein